MLRSLAGAQGAFTSRGAKPKGLNLMLLGLTKTNPKQNSKPSSPPTNEQPRCSSTEICICPIKWCRTYMSVCVRLVFCACECFGVSNCVCMCVCVCVCVFALVRGQRHLQRCSLPVPLASHRHSPTSRFSPSPLEKESGTTSGSCGVCMPRSFGFRGACALCVSGCCVRCRPDALCEKTL